MKLLDQIKEFDVTAPLPQRLLVVEQHFDAPQVADVAAATRAALDGKRAIEARRGGGDRRGRCWQPWRCQRRDHGQGGRGAT